MSTRRTVCVAWAVVAFVGTVVGVAGCGPSSFGDFRDQLVERSCARLVRCGRVAAGATGYCPVPAELLPIVAQYGGDLDIDTAVERGWLAFISGGAQHCLDAVGGAACDDAEAARTTALACHHVIGPGVAVGNRCPEDPTCIGGVCAARECGGLCVAYPGPGAACLADGGVGDGGRPLDCDPTIEYCAAGSCAYHQQSGGKCVSDGECGFGLSCNSGKCGSLPTVATGGVCDATHPCHSGEGCFNGTCQLLVGNGALCDAASGAVPCADGLVCRLRVVDAGASAVCAAPSGAGGSCRTVTDESGCSSDEVCTAGDGGTAAGPGTCQSPIANRAVGPGQLCDATHPCAAGLFCSTSSDTCTFLGGRGAACIGDASECLPGLECAAGINSPRPSRTGNGSLAVDAGSGKFLSEFPVLV